MVKYYGRARQRIGSVNTNQIGLNMSGCPSKVGRQGYLSRYIARRSQCNLKFCGPVFYHGVPWKWNSGRCVAKAPRGQSFNSGVGHKTTPRFACGNTCSETLDVNIALTKINDYFIKLFGNTGSVVLVGKFETLQSDGVHSSVPTFLEIKHYYPGTEFYKNAPINIKTAIDFVNNLNLSFRINTNKKVEHVIGFLDFTSQNELINLGYGIKLRYNPDSFVIAFGKNDNDISNKSECVSDACSPPTWAQSPLLKGCFEAAAPAATAFPLIGTKPISPYLLDPTISVLYPLGEKIRCTEYKNQILSISGDESFSGCCLARKQQWCVNNLLGFNSGDCYIECKFNLNMGSYGYALNMISQNQKTKPGSLQNPSGNPPLTLALMNSALLDDSHIGPLLDPGGSIGISGEHIAICDPALNDKYVFALFSSGTTEPWNYHFVRKDTELDFFKDIPGVPGQFNIWSSKYTAQEGQRGTRPDIVDSSYSSRKIIYSYTDPSNCVTDLPQPLRDRMTKFIAQYTSTVQGSTVPLYDGFVNIKDATFNFGHFGPVPMLNTGYQPLQWRSFWKYSPDSISQGDGNGHYINGNGSDGLVSKSNFCGKVPSSSISETSELLL